MKKTITLAKGDGIGPEIANSVLEILKKAGADLDFEEIEIGEKAYIAGAPSGIPDSAWDVIHKNKILLKAPLTTPQGTGYKSVNVTLRKSLGLFANIRPVRSFPGYVPNSDKKMDMVIIRENEEDLYAGVEYRSSLNTRIAVKIITHKGCERIIRYAFEYARLHNRKRVSCIIKDNIMKITDGLFHKIFKEIALEYPDINTDSIIVDIGSAKIATKPWLFDVIVTLNLYGDIISDIAAEVSGSVGLAGSSNIGAGYAIFEAVHGSAPDIAGKNIANPSGLLNAAILMLNHIGQGDIATKIENALLKTIEDGVHTADIYNESISTKKANTKEFTDAVVSNLGKLPYKIQVVENNAKVMKSFDYKAAEENSIVECIGVDIFTEDLAEPVYNIVEKIRKGQKNLEIKHVSARGMMVWSEATDRCSTNVDGLVRFRFFAKNKTASNLDVIEVQKLLNEIGMNFHILHKLYLYDGQEGFTNMQGQ
ncbi:Isocitrate dehydrogenase [Candidatus Cyrtobacter comes]|uniref:Isocitrate dehydrogenase [NADP] n=2 Tax=Candidatus Cyrtobacter comes TaxID=675776 RepID=A0ABU5L704_9RICK|nr:NADP-dependent isocitrate dehydrogenase [Candidatus Cyrtobacter comes]MDZ5761914.1 Isocitrate dehydrogenase [Candidatus Cyrtobacter comes]